MLVLSRKSGESICIGDNIIVRVVALTGGRVKLAIDAPRSVVIDREEVHERKEREQAAQPIVPLPHGLRGFLNVA